MSLLNGLAHEPLQPVPRGKNLRQRFFRDDAPGTVERDALVHLDAEVRHAGAARAQRVEQFRMGGDAGAAPDQLDLRAFVDVDVPADAAQERGGEQAGHRAADDDGTALARG